MTDAHNQDNPYTVRMHTEVGDLIDFALSPMDGAIAVAQVHDVLPQLHRPRWWHKLIPNHLRIYRGLLDWGPGDIGFSYVQMGNTLHVIDGGCVATRGLRRFRPNVTLPEPDAEKYLLEEADHGGGVSVLTIG